MCYCGWALLGAALALGQSYNIQTVAGTTRLINGAPANAGITPGSPGLYQVDIQVPPGTPNGNLPLVISIGGIQSPAGAYLPVQAPSQ